MSENYVGFTAVDFAEDGLFIRWVNHPDERSDTFWESFLEEHPEKREDIKVARNIVASLNFRQSSMDESSYRAVREGFLSTIREEKSRKKTANIFAHSNTWKQLLRIAAVLAISVTGLAIYRAGDRPSVGHDDQLTAHPDADAVHTEERVNPRGQKSVLALPDGSKVWLNVDSKLTYAKDFRKMSKREVQLEGEAFFSVAHNDSVPFIVHTSSSIRIEVLGTSFNVKSYHGDETVETTLVDGRVSIDKLEKNGLTVSNLILRPNQRAVYFKGSNTLDVRDVNAVSLSSWRNDYLVFDETPFADVLSQLERWYDVKIYLPEEVKSDLPCTLTANIQQESLEDVLKLLETSHRITYSINDDEVVISGKLCKD